MEEGREGERWVDGDGDLFSGESGRYDALIVVKGLLRCISRRDRVPPSGATGRDPASIKSDTCIRRLRAASMIPQPSSMSCRLQFARMPILFSEDFLGGLTLLATRGGRRCWSGCIGGSVLSDIIALLSEGFLGFISSFLQRRKNNSIGLAALESWELISGHMIACSEIMAQMKMDECFSETSFDEQIFVASASGYVNGGRTGGIRSGSAVFLFQKVVNTEM